MPGFAPRVGDSLANYKGRSFDHAKAGKTTAVKHQGACGSCWAFTANTVLEGTLALKKGCKPVRLSEQHLVDCTKNGVKDQWNRNYNNNGCKGGLIMTGWLY